MNNKEALLLDEMRCYEEMSTPELQGLAKGLVRQMDDNQIHILITRL